MKTKFDIGETVFVPATITSIYAHIDKETSYEMEVAIHGHFACMYAEESELDVVKSEVNNEQQT